MNGFQHSSYVCWNEKYTNELFIVYQQHSKMHIYPHTHGKKFHKGVVVCELVGVTRKYMMHD